VSVATSGLWKPTDYFLEPNLNDADGRLADLAGAVYDRVCRDRFDSPGFCLIDVGPSASSRSLRQAMVSLKDGLQHIHQARTGKDLLFVSAGRFDQQVSTKFHRDGGDDEAFLMLGYEPSTIESQIAIADYTKCAFDLGLTPSAFLDRFNPMFNAGEAQLRPYITTVDAFSNQRYQILLINNSIACFSADAVAWQGVLHTATIQNPSSSSRRVVNSTMVASVPLGSDKSLSREQIAEFLATSLVRRRGYDLPERYDDE
jgi:hypothetical protein